VPIFRVVKKKAVLAVLSNSRQVAPTSLRGASVAPLDLTAFANQHSIREATVSISQARPSRHPEPVNNAGVYGTSRSLPSYLFTAPEAIKTC